jgi:hypothetical protein
VPEHEQMSRGTDRLPESLLGEGGDGRQRPRPGVVGSAVLEMCACIESSGQECTGEAMCVEIELQESFDAHGKRDMWSRVGRSRITC